MIVQLYFDGLCERDVRGGPRNPGGRACYGFVARNAERNEILVQGCDCIGRGESMSNNVAEYAALIAGLQALIDRQRTDCRVVVQGDSMLVIKQMQGEWRVRAPHISLLHDRAQELAGRFRAIEFRWVPREENLDADELSRRAYQRAGPNVAGL